LEVWSFRVGSVLVGLSMAHLLANRGFLGTARRVVIGPLAVRELGGSGLASLMDGERGSG
jgi:hypothetical protein